MRIDLPEDVAYVITTLEAAGFEAYAVGGCVRDSCLERTPDDWDVTTSAMPQEIKATFRHTVDTGIEHGTVTVLCYHPDETIGAYEVTTYRIDGKYEDGRHPDHVEFTPSLTEDLRRRDFTINAMAYNPRLGMVDKFDGLGDLSRKVIRCVGVAEERFNEDALRILRAVRFSAQLGFEIEEETAAAIRVKAPNLAKISKERVYTEISKLICSSRHERIETVKALGLSPYIAEGFAVTEPADVRLPEIPIEERYLRYAVLFRHALPETAAKFLRELKADNDTVRGTVALAPMLEKELPEERYELKRIIGQMGREYFEDLLTLKAELGQDVSSVRALYEDITAKKEPVFLKDLAVGGAEIVLTGKKGPEVGERLEELLDLVRKYPEKNNREELLHYGEV